MEKATKIVIGSVIIFISILGLLVLFFAPVLPSYVLNEYDLPKEFTLIETSYSKSGDGYKQGWDSGNEGLLLFVTKYEDNLAITKEWLSLHSIENNFISEISFKGADAGLINSIGDNLLYSAKFSLFITTCFGTNTSFNSCKILIETQIIKIDVYLKQETLGLERVDVIAFLTLAVLLLKFKRHEL